MTERIVRVLAASFLALLLLAGCGSDEPERDDLIRALQKTTDENRAAEENAVPTESHPLAGFWKDRDCSDNFGLAIGPASEDMYYVSFCGPGGCFEPGTYRPNTPIQGDPHYKVISLNIIEVRGRDGFTTYFRCPEGRVSNEH